MVTFQHNSGSLRWRITQSPSRSTGKEQARTPTEDVVAVVSSNRTASTPHSAVPRQIRSRTHCSSKQAAGSDPANLATSGAGNPRGRNTLTAGRRRRVGLREPEPDPGATSGNGTRAKAEAFWVRRAATGG
uniref:Uncharacterized protein n=1 Tax=Arundo donax TaxID=35708 RepID=A0A0A9AP14_ARUDO